MQSFGRNTGPPRSPAWWGFLRLSASSRKGCAATMQSSSSSGRTIAGRRTRGNPPIICRPTSSLISRADGSNHVASKNAERGWNFCSRRDWSVPSNIVRRSQWATMSSGLCFPRCRPISVAVRTWWVKRSLRRRGWHLLWRSAWLWQGPAAESTLLSLWSSSLAGHSNSWTSTATRLLGAQSRRSKWSLRKVASLGLRIKTLDQQNGSFRSHQTQ